MEERIERKETLTRCLILFGLLGVLAPISIVYCLGNIHDPLVHPGEPALAPTAIGDEFNPAYTGTIVGQVSWNGPVPKEEPYDISRLPPFDRPFPKSLVRENPNLPVIDAVTGGINHTVVFLREIDLKRSRPWDHAPVRVEIDDYRLLMRQGTGVVRTGLVRRGDPVEMVSNQAYCHGLHANGAAFFTLMLPDPNRPSSRRLNQRGVVDLTSAAGCYWMRGYVLVDDHPYYTRTDAQGQFTLPQVPAGTYQIVCWLPNWMELRRERDPEIGLITRLVFLPPVERSQTVIIEPGQVRSVDFTLSLADFQ